MHLEEFAEGNSLLHRIDPRVKIITFLIFCSFCSSSNHLKISFLYFLYGLFLLIIAKLRLKALAIRLLAANFFILFIWIFIPLSHPGNPYFEIGPFKVSLEGVSLALNITLKCNAIILATLSLLATSNIFSLAHALLHFKVPAKLVTIFFLFYRYITVMHEEYLQIKRTLLARGFISKTNFHTYQTYAYLVGALILKSFERADEIYKAMLCRGFRGFFPLLEHFTLKKVDLIFGFLSSLVSILIWLKI